MSNLAQTSTQLSLADRVRAKLAGGDAAMPVPGGRALLLDVSGSMAENCGDGRSKLEALRAVARDIACPVTWAFSNNAVRVRDIDDLVAGGSTMLGRAIEALRREGATHIAIITDGLPTDPDRALRAVAGLRIDIFYVGPQPAPLFLSDLARSAATGSSNQSASLAQRKQLTQSVRKVLMLSAAAGRVSQ